MARMSKKSMVEFLEKHFRYDTMNSWNRSTSFAARVKVCDGWVPRELRDEAYEMINMEEVYEDISLEFDDFARRHDWQYQLGFNGRSGG